MPGHATRGQYEDLRTIPSRMPQGWHPPVPAYSAELDVHSTVAYYGVQCPTGAQTDAVREFRRWISTITAGADAPDVREYADYVDASGYYTWIATLYWRDGRDRFTRWAASEAYRAYWDDPRRLTGPVGVFREVFDTGLDRWETIYSNPTLQAGIATGCPAHAGPIDTHNYWGAMRDRIPASAADPLDADANATSIPDPARAQLGPTHRVRLDGTANLAVIHSGQLVGSMAEQEHALYRHKLVDALERGMEYLRDNPAESGCYSCRYMTETDADGTRLASERTFGLAAFVSLRHLEQWAEFHPSHLRIFHRFLRLAEQVGGDPTLPLWHQVFVCRAADQAIEYVNCHSMTGFLPYAAFTARAADHAI